MHRALDSYLVCPECGADVQEGLVATSEQCRRCERRFFSLDGMPCWFPSGQAQRALWEHLLAQFQRESAEMEKAHLAQLGRPGLLPQSRRRSQRLHEQRVAQRRFVSSLLRDSGLRPREQPEFAGFATTGLAQYYELMLRDWAWTDEASAEGYRVYEDENLAQLVSLQPVLTPLAARSPRRICVLGAGAGRLAWDLHQRFSPEVTVALDSHPVLSCFAHQVIKRGRWFSLSETRRFPHQGLPQTRQWPAELAVTGYDHGASRDDFVVLGGDAFRAPFASGSFDLVVTPWFIDINGTDPRRTLGVVQRLLQPGGHWLNVGPFLYPETLIETQHYTPEEIRALNALAGITPIAEHFFSSPYTWSPLSQRGRVEESWAFLAEVPERPPSAPAPRSLPREEDAPPWWILPHLCIPDLRGLARIPESLANLGQLLDGTRSIDDLAELVAPNLPKEEDPEAFIRGFLREYCFAGG